jgi:hypothetical protein
MKIKIDVDVLSTNLAHERIMHDINTNELPSSSVTMIDDSIAYSEHVYPIFLQYKKEYEKLINNSKIK